MTTNHGIAGFLTAWRERRQLRRELDSLTDRELWELGFSRHDIPRVVRGDVVR